MAKGLTSLRPLCWALVGATLILFWWLDLHSSAPVSSPKSPPPLAVAFPLPLDHVVTRRLAAEEIHTFAVAVPAGRLFHLIVDQEGIDVVLRVRRPGGETLLEVDSPNRSWGTEELWWIAPQSGTWHLEIRPWSPAPQSTYRLRNATIGPPAPGDQLRAHAWQATGRAERARAAGDIPRARQELAMARDLWRQAGEPGQESLAEMRLADLLGASGEIAEEISSYRSALALVRRLRDGRQEANILLRLGDAQRRSGDLDGAWRTQLAAERLARAQGLTDDEAAALTRQADILQGRGEIRAARERYRRALALFRRLGNRGQMAATLHGLGASASFLGLFDEAEQSLKEALALWRALGSARGAGMTLTELGWVYRLRALQEGGEKSGEARDQARRLLEVALVERRADGDLAGEAGTLDRLGTVHRDAGRWDEALACYQLSLGLTPRSSLRNVAHTLNNQAELWLERGDLVAAHRLASRAAANFAALPVPDPFGTAHAQYLLGRAAAASGDATSARRSFESALGTIETLREELGDQTLTLPFFALRQSYFEGTIESLMDLDARAPGSGFAQAALETSERARMRTLLDSLADRRNQDRGARLRDELHPVTLSQIQELLDDETVLLEYSLGEERGFVWAIDRHSMTSHPIPGRRDLLPLVRQAYRAISRSSGDLEAPRRLARLLLDPVADRLQARRLVVVTDGLLAYIPFAALPWPDRQPLIERYEIVRLPSVTTLEALRRRATASVPVEHETIAVLADPVFSSWDSRVHSHRPILPEPPPADREDLTRSVSDLGLDRLRRLPATRREAEAITSMAPGSFVALDFSAGRDTLKSPAVRDANILHLATHGLLNSKNPSLSGIVLSLVDAQGRPQEGFLRAEEVSELALNAELVVLSACKTALGPEVRGEGLLGLSRAFLIGGARQVVVSLWNIEDRASADLMERFYDGLLREGLEPAAALRRAQLALRSNPDRKEPADWAGFELQGDWR